MPAQEAQARRARVADPGLRRRRAAAACILALAGVVVLQVACIGLPPKNPVVLGGETLFYLYGRAASLTPHDRAEIVSDRLRQIAHARRFEPGQLTVVHTLAGSDILYRSNFVVTILEADAEPLGLNRRVLAERYETRIKEAITRYREGRSVARILRSSAYALLITLALIVIVRLLLLAHARASLAFSTMLRSRLRPIRIGHADVIRPEHVAALFRSSWGLLKALALAAILYGYLAVVFGLFPWTEGYAAALLEYTLGHLRTLGQATAAAIPNLLFVVIIILMARVVLKGFHVFFRELETGTIALHGFDRDWAMPTYKLVRVVVVLLAAAAAFPYIPGSRSPAFQAISVLVGVLISLGSSSAVSNVVAGVVLTYMRPFRVGDRVRIADTVGDVVEKSLLVTRIRTPKNVEVTVPNSLVLGSHISNFSAQAREGGLILHTTVTIGYDVPWRQVHELLISAALHTSGILATPRPFVLQTSLNDYHVSYELNAYTDLPDAMPAVYSRLHENIQDAFAAAGVEILSPMYNAIRDGDGGSGKHAGG